jgi:hypothetical protein|tara:strand:- start:194 stop:298 length:105 start_codon:yes stop_codon:yes gene_type:complete
MRIVEAFNKDPLDVISKNMFLFGDYKGLIESIPI